MFVLSGEVAVTKEPMTSFNYEKLVQDRKLNGASLICREDTLGFAQRSDVRRDRCFVRLE